MKKIYLLVLLSMMINDINAQSFNWGKREGLWAYDYGYGIVNDNAGNVYVAGKYEEDAIFSGTTLTNAGNHDMFLAKYTPAGAVDWIRTAGGSLGDYAHALAIDASGNLIAVGEIEGYGNVVSFPGSATTLTCIGDNDLFIAKYDPNGTLLWAKSEGYNWSEKALAVATDLLGNVYITGYYTDTTKINGVTYISNGGRDFYLAKYDANGNFQWMKRGGSPTRDEGLGITCDATGNVYVCGMHSANAVFETTTLTAGGASYPDYDIFLAKYNSLGVLQWIKSPGSDYDDVAWSVVMDNAGKIYITGEYNAYAIFDSFALTTSGNAEVYVACYDASGNVQWVTSAGGPLIDRARGMGCDGTNLYITGQFGGTAMFGTNSITAADSSDVFIAALNSSGNFIWATSIGGVADSLELLGYESGNAVCAETTGSVYATGAVLDGGVFGTTTVSEYARTDVFVAKITAAGVGIAEAPSEEQHLFPNPSNGLFKIRGLDMRNRNEIIIYNAVGTEVKRISPASSECLVNLGDKAKGLYFARIISGEDQRVEEIIVQ